MTTLILGHEYCFKSEDIRCSPIDVKLWYYKPFTCVSFMCDKDQTDIVYDLYKSIDYRFTKGNEEGIKYKRPWHWAFAEDNSYDEIIDCIGRMYWIQECRHNSNIDKDWSNLDKIYIEQDSLLETILRVLKIGGKFYSYFGIYTKINEKELALEKKELYGYQYKTT